MIQGPDLKQLSDDQLRAEVRRRGYEMHSKQFSLASQQLIRELPELRRRLEALEAIAMTADTPSPGRADDA